MSLLVKTAATSSDAKDACAALKQSDLYLSASVPIFDELPKTSSRGASNIKLNVVLYDSIHKTLVFPNYNASRGFQVSIFARPWTLDAKITSYCFDTPEEMDMFVKEYCATFYLGILSPGCKDGIPTFAHGSTRYETDMSNAVSKFRAYLGETVSLQGREQNKKLRFM